MRFIELGIALVVIGLILGFAFPGSAGGLLVSIGWLLVIAGVILAILHFALGGTWGYRRAPPPA
jgi:hypothetical protein